MECRRRFFTLIEFLIMIAMILILSGFVIRDPVRREPVPV